VANLPQGFHVRSKAETKPTHDGSDLQTKLLSLVLVVSLKPFHFHIFVKRLIYILASLDIKL
jgi:hypothetical protein